VTDNELREILDDETKAITGDIQWGQDRTMSYVMNFRVKVENELGFPLWVKGSYNRELDKTSFTLFDQNTGRIYGIDSGQDHHNASCDWVGDLHAHQWNEITKDREATTFNWPSNEALTPVGLWREFCHTTGIRHDGVLSAPPTDKQMKMF
jgi:hypothetical protein